MQGRLRINYLIFDAKNGLLVQNKFGRHIECPKPIYKLIYELNAALRLKNGIHMKIIFQMYIILKPGLKEVLSWIWRLGYL